MALLTVTQDELEMIRLAMAALRSQVKKDAERLGFKDATTPTADAIIIKANEALTEIQKDLDLEKTYSSSDDLLDVDANLK
jgi:hypothetical protein